jgi:hypothetical protein
VHAGKLVQASRLCPSPGLLPASRQGLPRQPEIAWPCVCVLCLTYNESVMFRCCTVRVAPAGPPCDDQASETAAEECR